MVGADAVDARGVIETQHVEQALVGIHLSKAETLGLSLRKVIVIAGLGTDILDVGRSQLPALVTGGLHPEGHDTGRCGCRHRGAAGRAPLIGACRLLALKLMIKSLLSHNQIIFAFIFIEAVDGRIDTHAWRADIGVLMACQVGAET